MYNTIITFDQLIDGLIKERATSPDAEGFVYWEYFVDENLVSIDFYVDRVLISERRATQIDPYSCEIKLYIDIENVYINGDIVVMSKDELRQITQLLLEKYE